MPYYCSVPRCTSMAGKAKNVSFHQFPRDEELAKLWNKILKRGKPYTKYSKVCSKHFTAADYTITSVGKNKGQWRTLRKDAIPSQNLPSDSPAPYQRQRNTGSWVREEPTPGILDPQLQQQMAQAIYMQTMLAMQATASYSADGNQSNDDLDHQNEAHASNEAQSQHTPLSNGFKTPHKCTECSKYFKDPDVFLLHKRTHEKENLNTNTDEKPALNPLLETLNSNGEETLKSNPILANLLKSQGNISLDVQNHAISLENQIFTAVKSMECYLRNLLAPQRSSESNEEASEQSDCDSNVESSDSKLVVNDSV